MRTIEELEIENEQLKSSLKASEKEKQNFKDELENTVMQTLATLMC